MHRRDTLRTMAVVVGSAWLAGCGSDDGSTGGNDDDPFEVPPNELLPPVTVLEDAVDISWEPRDEIETGLVTRAQESAAYRATGHNSATLDAVEVGVSTFEDVDAARTQFEELPYHEGWDMASGDLAVESLVGVVDSEREYRSVFRDANAIGGLAYRNARSGNESRMRRVGGDLAGAMHRYWRE